MEQRFNKVNGRRAGWRSDPASVVSIREIIPSSEHNARELCLSEALKGCRQHASAALSYVEVN
jgi:hypothetical protein